jgi:hypothetical protein
MFDNENNKIDFDNINKNISSIDKHNVFEYSCNKLFENKKEFKI